ncbi:protein suppressor of sable-like [Anopheles albimanus]|uniref:protein suppressor of sable-like n=1 Tax=Anopheles albimanus TaxID=7167 RepID=UPI00163DE6F4|nr:protein suppressor of sable-like [Anopheles albimanus]XP_035787164.1 protein suppressor of sable-like [Anopheles albimanus]XP_035787165.1 protein suppressor of sable-like [Anopheles albimanus]XP_035787166.1 protein suppressor of sable-like [Anopheles albimanus]
MSDPEDLEDGEIEDDDEEEVVVVKPEDPPLGQPMPNDAEDFDEKSASKAVRREEQHPSGGKGGPQRQQQRASNKPAPVVDDWATKVESAIAKELIKDGVEPPMPSVALGHNEDDVPRSSPGGPTGGGRKSKKRKKSSRGGGGGGGGGGVGGDLAQPSIKQQRLNDDAGDLGEQDLEYEMLNMRGGSPQPMAMGGGANIMPDGMSGGESENDTHYSSDESSSVRDHHHHHHHRGGGAGDRDHRTDRERDRERERDQRLAERERDRERDREYNRNKRKQQKQQQQQQARQRNAKPNRDNRKRKRDDSDDEKHRPTGPRKMELCKFYLMDCCAKREKCLYMHKDFPCKYYYLGMKCKEKELCHFSHGEPLTNDLRAILLKHLETAPQEILGSFQRISRDTANNLLNATHRKLMEKYGRGDGGDDEGMKIPALMDGMHGGGNSRQQQQQHHQQHHRKRWCDEPNRRTPDDEDDRLMRHQDGAEGGPLGLQHLAGVITRDQINDLEQMGIRTLDEISQLTVAQLNDLGLSITQIHDLQVKALSMKRSRDSSVDRAGARGRPGAVGQEDRLRGERSSVDRSAGAATAKDLDMRIRPGGMSEPTGVPQQQGDVDMRVFPPNGQGQPKGAETSTEPSLLPSALLPLKPPTVDYSQYIKDSNLDEEDLDAVAAANPAALLNANQQDEEDDDDDDDDDDDENNLKINIEEEEDEQQKKDQEEGDEEGEQQGKNEGGQVPPLLPPLVPPKIDYAQGLGDLLLYGGSLDKSSVASKPPSVASPRTEGHHSPPDAERQEENGAPKLDLLNSDEIWTPSMSLLSSSSSGGGASVAPIIAEVKPQPGPPAGGKRRTTGPPSIYDWDDSDQVSSPDGASSPVNSSTTASTSTPFRYGSSDRALPLNINDDEDEDGVAGGLRARDLGLPFKPMMANYVPATEIDGSIGSHATIIYKVYVVDVPKPNFKSLRRSMQRPMGTRDPRLRRLFGLHSDEEDAKDSHDDGDTSEGIKSPDASSIASPPYGVPSLLPGAATGGTAQPPLASPQAAACSSPSSSATARRVDPRKRHAEKMAAAAAQQQQDGAGPGFGPGGLPPPPSSSGGPNATPQLDVQTILQRSAWYKDLGTKHKIMVNQQLAILSTEMKKYHSSDRSTEQLSEFMKFLGTNSMLQHILTCLNVYVDHTVAFCEVTAVPRLQSPPSFPLLANIPPPIVTGAGGGPAPGPGGGMPPHLSVPVHIPPPLNVQQPPPLGLPQLGNPLTGGPPPSFLNQNNNNNGGGGGGGGPGPGGGNNGPPVASRFGPPLGQHEGPPGPGGMGPLPPGLLGIAPNMPFEQFLAMGNLNKAGDHGGGGGGGGGVGGGNIPPWTQGNANNHMRNNGNNMRNNNRIGHNFRNNNDRWVNNGGGGGGGGGGNNGGGNNRRNNRRMDRKK